MAAINCLSVSIYCINNEYWEVIYWTKDKYGATIANIYQWASKLKDEFISDKDGKSDSNEKENSDKDDKHSATIGHIYQWASKLKEDFTSEASNMTYEVSEKALAMMLNRLVDGVEAELKAFDKKV